MISLKIKGAPEELAKIRKTLAEAEAKHLFNMSAATLQKLKSNTPVDTGKARDGWEMQVGKDIKIVNNVPYIDALNAGHSKQAPQFFVERAVMDVGRPSGALVNYRKKS